MSAIKLADLSPETRAAIGKMRYDCFIEKHKGPWDWAGMFRYGEPEFLRVEGRYDVLLPIHREQHPNITVLRCDAGADGNSLTLFLKDTTHCTDPKYEIFDAGRVAICDRFPGEQFFVAIFYHAWYISC